MNSINLGRKFIATPSEFEGLIIIKKTTFRDERGVLLKHFQSDYEHFVGAAIDDIYTTSSYRDVVRGCHHQIEPYGQLKIVTCLKGSFWDVAIDLRKNSATYNKIFTYHLKASSDISLLIPRGFSHGTYSTSDRTIMLSACSGKYLPEFESGILMSSLNLGFYDVSAKVSKKDSQLSSFNVDS
jgi:dTDP-4-dehydrorhamnose 3,5-epimerase